MKVCSVNPDDEAYTLLKSLSDASESKEIPYEEIARRYNELEVGGFATVPTPDYPLSNIRRVLNGRGLTNEVDFKVTRITRDRLGYKIPNDLRLVLLQRLSVKPMRVLDLSPDV